MVLVVDVEVQAARLVGLIASSAAISARVEVVDWSSSRLARPSATVAEPAQAVRQLGRRH